MAVSVSVIIPTYNRAALVEQCISSLQASGLRGLEVVVADDGSTDDTESVVRRFKDAIYVRQPNAGPAAARNRGFVASHGRYVSFLDSDDEWIAGRPQRLVDQLGANPDLPLIFADTSIGNATDGFASFVDTYGGSSFHALPAVVRPGGVRVLHRSPFLRQLSTRNVMFLGSLLVRREAFAAIGMFDPELRGAADWEFFMRMAAAHDLAYSEGPPVSIYLKHADGMSTDDDHMHRDFILALLGAVNKCQLSPGDRAHLEDRLREHLFQWGYRAYDRGDLIEARSRFMRARDLHLARGRGSLYLAATYCPPRFVELLRRARRGLGI